MAQCSAACYYHEVGYSLSRGWWVTQPRLMIHSAELGYSLSWGTSGKWKIKKKEKKYQETDDTGNILKHVLKRCYFLILETFEKMILKIGNILEKHFPAGMPLLESGGYLSSPDRGTPAGATSTPSGNQEWTWWCPLSRGYLTRYIPALTLSRTEQDRLIEGSIGKEKNP